MRSVLVVVIAIAAASVAAAQPAEPGAGDGSAGTGSADADATDTSGSGSASTDATSTGAGSNAGAQRPPGGASDASMVAPPPQPDHDPVKLEPWKPGLRHSSDEAGLRFGSYGRIVVGSDLQGGKPEKIKVTAVAPRIVEPSYLELELSYGFDYAYGTAPDEHITIRPIVTLAFNDTLFHANGEFDAKPALRNMYVIAKPTPRTNVWAGSRMYRGDDIYLFDYWPLDDQNTVGGGVGYTTDSLSLAAHVGWNRLDDAFTFQQIEVPDPEQGATTVTLLDRQRTVASMTGSYTHPLTDDIHVRAKVHGEYHALPSGVRQREDGTREDLPADSGVLAGMELSTWGFQPAASGLKPYANLFARYATGLATFDELAAPTSLGANLKTTGANELLFGLSAGWDASFGNILLGALSRRFIDADADAVDHDDGWEYAVNARPVAKLVRGLFAGADISYQARFPRGLNPITLRAQDAAVFQIAPMFVYSPLGPAAYDRPQIRVVYRLAHLDQGARDLYVPDDPRHDRAWVHYIGIQAEWWFNSANYPRR